MGFETQNTNSSKPVTYLSIVSEKEGEKTIGKFFRATKKVNGEYQKEILKNTYNYPLPFFGYITDIIPKLDNTFMRDGKPIPSPKIAVHFIDDNKDTYILDLPFTNDKGRVSGNVVTLLNSLASIKKYGLLKVYITSTDAKDKTTGQPTGEKNYTINVRNDIDWNPNTPEYKRFLTPEDKTVVDVTKVSWKYEYKTIPPVEIETEVGGRLRKVDNTEEHQQWFLDLINKEILPVVKSSVYSSKDVDPTTTVTNSTPVTNYESDIPEDDDIPTSSNSTSTTSEDGNDLPF